MPSFLSEVVRPEHFRTSFPLIISIIVLIFATEKPYYEHLMNKLIKAFALLVITSWTFLDVHAGPTPENTETNKIIILHKEDIDQGNKHLPHRTPARDNILPVVSLDAECNCLIFSASSPTSFAYFIYGPSESAFPSGEIQLYFDDMQETVNLSGFISGEYTIVLVINGQRYSGVFDV